jgi:hypothetical protein
MKEKQELGITAEDQRPSPLILNRPVPFIFHSPKVSVSWANAEAKC